MSTTTTRPATTPATAVRINPVKLGLRQGGLEIRQFLRSRESVVFTLALPGDHDR